MTMFDSIITGTDERFNLNGKAGTLLSSLLSLMTDSARGGLAGFLERINQADLSKISASWVSSDENAEISNEQIESALGKDTLNDISNQIGGDYDETIRAAAFMIPRVVDALTPDGVMPQDGDLLSRIGGFLNDVEGKTDNVSNRANDNYKINNSPLGWILPLMLLGLLLTLGYWFCSKAPAETININTNQANTNTANQ